jgi:anti-anti-sigma regulatory factor
VRSHDEDPPPGTAVWELGPVIARGDVPGLTEHLSGLLRDGDAAVVICDVAAVTHPDAATLDVLARLQLVARRLGGRLWLCHAGGPLRELITLAGLRDVLPLHPGLSVEPGRQAEQREQPVGVEEGVHPDDLPG